MTDQTLTASTVEEYREVFIQAMRCFKTHGRAIGDTAQRFAWKLADRIDQMLLDDLDALRALVAEKEREDESS